MLGRADGGSAEPLENTLRVSKFDMSTIVTRGEEIDKIVAKANPSRVIVEIKFISKIVALVSKVDSIGMLVRPCLRSHLVSFLGLR